MPLWLKLLAPLLAFLAALYALHRLMIWMERKGWIYYRKARPKKSMRSSLGFLQELVQPEIRHVKEDQTQRREVYKSTRASNDP